MKHIRFVFWGILLPVMGYTHFETLTAYKALRAEYIKDWNYSVPADATFTFEAVSNVVNYVAVPTLALYLLCLLHARFYRGIGFSGLRDDIFFWLFACVHTALIAMGIS